jgi:hypothetical protein
MQAMFLFFLKKINISTCSNSYLEWWVQCHKSRVYHPDKYLIPANSRERRSAEISSVFCKILNGLNFQIWSTAFYLSWATFAETLASFRLILTEKPVFLTKKRFSIFRLIYISNSNKMVYRISWREIVFLSIFTIFTGFIFK